MLVMDGSKVGVRVSVGLIVGATVIISLVVGWMVDIGFGKDLGEQAVSRKISKLNIIRK